MKKKIAVILTLCLLACTSLTACQTSSAPESTIPTSLPSVNSETAISETVSNTEPSNESSTELSEESSEMEDTSTISSTAENSVEETSEEISQTETSPEISAESSSEEKIYSMDDVIQYGKMIHSQIIQYKKGVLFQPGSIVCILNVYDDTVDILFENMSFSIPIESVELLPNDYILNERERIMNSDPFLHGMQ